MRKTRSFAAASLVLSSVLVLTACGGAPREEEESKSAESALSCTAPVAVATTRATTQLPTGESVSMVANANGGFDISSTAPGSAPITTPVAPANIPAHRFEVIGNEAFIILTNNGVDTSVGIRDSRYDAATDTLTFTAAFPDGRLAPMSFAGYGLQEAFKSNVSGQMNVRVGQVVGIIAACAASGLAFAVCLAIAALIAFLAWICLRAIQAACAGCASAGMGCHGAISWDGCHGTCVPVTGTCKPVKTEPDPIPN